jgi:HSP20 family protein
MNKIAKTNRPLFLSDFFGSNFNELVDGIFNEQPLEDTVFKPAVEMSETDNDFLLTVSIPGVDKKDITLEIDEGFITIKGERTSKKEKEEAKVIYKEIRTGSFLRKVRVPKTADPSLAKAQYENGLLNLTIPKKEDVKPKVISIK